jgi:hypothetical protein
MAERIKARIGDVVETTFNLAFKKAEVARLPNPRKFEAIDFFMLADKGGKVMTGAGREFSDGSSIRCAVREVTQDDQPITAQFRFADSSQNRGFFAVGDVWKLFLSYSSKDESPTGDPKDPDSHLLAEVELVSADQAAAPAK